MIVVEHKPLEPIFGQLLLEGDEQSGTDALLLEGDEQSGADALRYFEVL